MVKVKSKVSCSYRGFSMPSILPCFDIKEEWYCVLPTIHCKKKNVSWSFTWVPIASWKWKVKMKEIILWSIQNVAHVVLAFKKHFKPFDMNIHHSWMWNQIFLLLWNYRWVLDDIIRLDWYMISWISLQAMNSLIPHVHFDVCFGKKKVMM